MRMPWWGYVILAGLAWGTYVPIIFFGSSEFGKGTGSRMMAILCVGLAYFVLGVLFPLGLFLSRQEQWPTINTTGLVFSGLAGVAGALGAICVVYASKAAMVAGDEIALTNPGFNASSFRILIAPLIFGTAPVINTLLSSIWHPKPGHPFHFVWDPPGWKLIFGILLIASGVFLVLYSKEEHELSKAPAAARAPGS